jgi:hypothetical protein
VHGRLVRRPAEFLDGVEDVPSPAADEFLQAEEFRGGRGSTVEQKPDIHLSGGQPANGFSEVGRPDRPRRQSRPDGRFPDEPDEIRVEFPIRGDGQINDVHFPASDYITEEPENSMLNAWLGLGYLDKSAFPEKAIAYP